MNAIASYMARVAFRRRGRRSIGLDTASAAEAWAEGWWQGIAVGAICAAGVGVLILKG